MKQRKTIIIVLIAALVLAAGIFSMYEYYQMKLDRMRAASIKELQESVDLSDYGEKNQEKIRKILDQGEDAILASRQQYEINQIMAETEGEIEEIPTIKQIRKEGRWKLKNLVSLDNYREDQQKQIQEIQKKYKKKINKKTEKKQIKKLLKEAKKELAKIKTDSELTAEEEAAREAELERQRLAAEAAEKARKEKEKEEKEKARKEAAKEKAGKKKGD